MVCQGRRSMLMLITIFWCKTYIYILLIKTESKSTSRDISSMLPLCQGSRSMLMLCQGRKAMSTLVTTFECKHIFFILLINRESMSTLCQWSMSMLTLCQGRYCLNWRYVNAVCSCQRYVQGDNVHVDCWRYVKGISPCRRYVNGMSREKHIFYILSINANPCRHYVNGVCPCRRYVKGDIVHVDVMSRK